ncbi:MAG: nitrile hydratase accessory protein [Actinomycetota bacterium]|jgi:nitrile hydratase accessory protein|nr:nitrile hydratase accessory protein [Actinomycetota bacterium]
MDKSVTSGDPGPEVLGSLPRDEEGPVFAEPWQAQAFAMTVRLYEQGHFTWLEWAAALSDTIAAAGQGDTTDYYQHWLATLEIVVSRIGLTSDPELRARRDAWQRAAEVTPHGQPIELGAELA